MTSIVNENIGVKPEFEKLYEYGSEIGKGRYSTVKKCYCKKTQKCYAAKIIKNFRSKNSKLNMNIVENEITALTIARPNKSIVNLYEVFYNRGETILILEYAEEKDLHIYLDNEGAFEEEQACHIIYQVLKAIEFLHSKNVLHLDIKPENVLLMKPLAPKSSPSNSFIDIDIQTNTENNQINKKLNIYDEEDLNEVEVKLCDFSFSQIMTPGKPILGMMGTVAYSAPEVLQYDALTKATDMWSLGVLTHVLLTEYTPFGNGTEELNQTQTNILNVRENDFECVEEYFDEISYEARDFIENLIKFRPKQRLTIEQALNHSWFKKYNIDNYSLESINTRLDTAEDNKENLTNIKLVSYNNMKNKNNNCNINEPETQNHLSMNKMNKKIDDAAGTKLMDMIKDDKNNNNVSSITESLTYHLQPTRKSTSSVLDGIIDTTSKELKNLESPN